MAHAAQALEETARSCEHALPVSSRSIRPRPDAAFLHLFHAVKARNQDDAPFVLQFVAPARGEGASAVAAGFAEAAAAQGAGPILCVDCDPGERPPEPPRQAAPSLMEAFSQTGGIDSALRPAPDRPGVFVARLCASQGAFARFDLGALARVFALAKQAFPIVALDSPPPFEAPEALALARAADGTVLVIGAGTTPQSRAAATKSAIERSGGQLIGCVLNRRRDYIPLWLRRRL